MRFFAFIPARAGSKRIKDKNVLHFNGKTLLQSAVESALACDHISRTYVSTDSAEYESLAFSYGAQSLGIRPESISRDTSHDKEWLLWSLNQLINCTTIFADDFYLILRPTSPFRTAETVRRAVNHFIKSSPDPYVTLRAVKRVTEHPGKMWILASNARMMRLLPFSTPSHVPWCDSQNTSLPDVYVQNACLEIGNIMTLLNDQNFPTSGYSSIPFLMDPIESIDINTPLDLEFANFMLSRLSSING